MPVIYIIYIILGKSLFFFVMLTLKRKLAFVVQIFIGRFVYSDLSRLMLALSP